MKKLIGVVLVFLLFVAGCPTALAFQNEHAFWDQWREHDRRHSHDREYVSHGGHGSQVVVKYRGRDEHPWYGHHQAANMRVYYSSWDRKRVSRVSYENYDGRYFLATMGREHGHYSYARYYHGDRHYYWIGRETIIKVVVREDGYSSTSVWYRSEAERSALELGYVSDSTIESYRYYDDMPPEVSERYIADIRLE
jgi:hypothetical protein